MASTHPLYITGPIDQKFPLLSTHDGKVIAGTIVSTLPYNVWAHILFLLAPEARLPLMWHFVLKSRALSRILVERLELWADWCFVEGNINDQWPSTRFAINQWKKRLHCRTDEQPPPACLLRIYSRPHVITLATLRNFVPTISLTYIDAVIIHIPQSDIHSGRLLQFLNRLPRLSRYTIATEAAYHPFEHLVNRASPFALTRTGTSPVNQATEIELDALYFIGDVSLIVNFTRLTRLSLKNLSVDARSHPIPLYMVISKLSHLAELSVRTDWTSGRNSTFWQLPRDGGWLSALAPLKSIELSGYLEQLQPFAVAITDCQAASLDFVCLEFYCAPTGDSIAFDDLPALVREYCDFATGIHYDIDRVSIKTSRMAYATQRDTWDVSWTLISVENDYWIPFDRIEIQEAFCEFLANAIAQSFPHGQHLGTRSSVERVLSLSSGYTRIQTLTLFGDIDHLYSTLEYISLWIFKFPLLSTIYFHSDRLSKFTTAFTFPKVPGAILPPIVPETSPRHIDIVIDIPERVINGRTVPSQWFLVKWNHSMPVQSVYGRIV